MPRVSLCIIAKNEEHRLGKCLGSAADLVDETIVVDTGSTDATKQIAAQHGAKVIDFPWCDDFAAARNESIRHATGDWIFWLDCDHWLDEENRQRLRRLFASLPDENVAYLMKWRSPSSEGDSQGTLLDATQLFRNDKRIRWQHRIHEQIRPSIQRSGGTTQFSDVVINHSGYMDPIDKVRKLERNLRLLIVENEERPNQVSTLFHLGWTYYLLGKPREAWQPLERALALSKQGETVVRKTYALLVRCARQTNRQQDAFNVCFEGRKHFPNDPELLFHEGQLRREGGDLAGAEVVLKHLLTCPPDNYIAASVDPSLKGYKGRCALAEVYRDQGRLEDAEREFRAALAEQPDLTPAWLCIGDMWLRNGQLEKVDQLCTQLQANPKTAIDGALLKARSLMTQKKFDESRELLQQTIARAPKNAWPRELLAHCLHLENRDMPALVEALKQVLILDPTNNFALANLPMAQQKLSQSL
jgi:glycosyltransferase involved in cell wall biosynthesis